MILKTMQTEVGEQPRYQVFDTVKMETPEGKMVDVLKPRERISIEECNERIKMMEDEIARATAELEKYQAMKAEIVKVAPIVEKPVEELIVK